MKVLRGVQSVEARSADVVRQAVRFGSATPNRAKFARKIIYPGVYRGIDLTYYGRNGSLEFDFDIASGVSHDVIELGFENVRSVHVDPTGDLILATVDGDIRYTRPIAYETVGGERVPRPAAFRIAGRNHVAFDIGGRDLKNPLTIDPVLAASTCWGGTQDDRFLSATVAADGTLYVAGETWSSDLPQVTASFPVNQRRNKDVLIARWDATRTNLLFVATVSGSAADSATGIAVDATGNAYVTGYTDSADFPTTTGAVQPSRRSGRDAFVLKLAASGLNLLYSGTTGGSGQDTATSIAVNSLGEAVVCGYTSSPDLPTTTGAAQTAFRFGSNDAFIGKVSADGSRLVFLTYWGGSDNDTANALAVDPADNIFVAGQSASTNLALTEGTVAIPASSNAFVVKLSAAGGVVYARVIGGSSFDEANAVVVSRTSEVWVGGHTASFDFPVPAGAVQTSVRGDYDGFIMKLDSTGRTIVSATFLGGSAADTVVGLTLLPEGSIGAVLRTSSSDLPVVNAAQSQSGGGRDTYIGILRSGLSALSYGSYFGGAGVDEPSAVAGSADGAIAIIGFSDSANLPTAASSRTGCRADVDAYVAQTTFGHRAPVITSVSPQSGSGLQQAFTVEVSDADGADDIAVIYLLISGSFSGQNACFVYVDRTTGTYSLLNDQYSGAAGTFTTGGTTSASNSQCTLQASGTSATTKGPGYAITFNIAFKSSYSGQKTLYAMVSDRRGLSSGWITSGSWYPQNAPPLIQSASPASGSGTRLLYSVTAADPQGAADIAQVYLLINSAFQGTSACYVYYSGATNTFSLLNDSFTGSAGSVMAGAPGVISNSQCSVDGSLSSATASGNSLLLTFGIVFKSPFAGSKTLYLQAQDRANGVTPWLTTGRWTVQSRPPSIAAVSPVSGSGTQSVITVTAADADGAEDISNIYVLLNSGFSGQNACFVYFSRSAGRFTVLNDSYTGTAGTVQAGSGTASNSQCALSGAPSAFSLAGNTMSVSFGLTFKSSFTGMKSLYVMAEDAGGGTSNWVTGGTWSVQSTAPAIASITPIVGSGTNASLSVRVRDADGAGDISQIYVLINSGFSAVSSCLAYYHKQTGAIWLLNDAGSGAAGAVPIGSSGSVSNTQCSALGSTSVGFPASDSVVLTLNLGLKSAFLVRSRTVYVMAEDSSGASTGWIEAGQWLP